MAGKFSQVKNNLVEDKNHFFAQEAIKSEEEWELGGNLVFQAKDAKLVFDDDGLGVGEEIDGLLNGKINGKEVSGPAPEDEMIVFDIGLLAFDGIGQDDEFEWRALVVGVLGDGIDLVFGERGDSQRLGVIGVTLAGISGDDNNRIRGVEAVDEVWFDGHNGKTKTPQNLQGFLKTLGCAPRELVGGRTGENYLTIL